ncbi:NUDIX domain-containing protein [Streptomyces profundus]|uniref:NUDIX domain-containing protein n=1 Tax=Streptomyces profundus TaxID=2867410 RepID=UPI001D1657E3|nr:NUDIX domain-containing protein [Streptomyces sp. MA3_2.13]UED83268.1 NUDIX domain-containing protein [Streptomyces sp. MA3_2.13]
MRTVIARSPVLIYFQVLATTASDHVLMVRGSEGWELPGGELRSGECVILAARETLWKTTGYERGLTDVLAVTLDTDESGRLNRIVYVLDGQVIPQVPADAKRLPSSAAWMPLREWAEAPPLVQYGVMSAGRRNRLPLLINGDRPESAFL